jgi:hypothetical protein
MALTRFAEETGLEVSTAAQLRAGDQREHSKIAPFHTALLVGHHVTGEAACIAGTAKIRCNSDDFAYFTVRLFPISSSPTPSLFWFRHHMFSTTAKVFFIIIYLLPLPFSLSLPFSLHLNFRCCEILSDLLRTISIELLDGSIVSSKAR